MIGHAWKIEMNAEMGHFWNLVVFLPSMPTVTFTESLAKHWSALTQGEGISYHHAVMVSCEELNANSTINAHDAVICYLTRTDDFVRYRPIGNYRSFGKTQIPKSMNLMKQYP